jgi:type II secretory pathway pseudopilin PulG
MGSWMSFLGAVGEAAGSATSVVVLALVAVIVVLAVVAVLAMRRATRNKETAGADRAVFAVAETCRSKGHAYQEYDTGWRCATCGNHVPRTEGELYGLVSDGRHERRRSGR